MSISASAAAALDVSGVTTPVVVVDTAANVALYMDPLAALANVSKLASITLTDTGIPSLAITPAQLISDASALLLVSNVSWTIALSGAATTGQVLSANPALVAMLAPGFAVSDTSTAILTNLAALEAVAGTIASITLTDATPALLLTGAQLIADAPVLLKITSAHTIVVSGPTTAAQAALMKNPLFALITRFTVADTAANVSSNLDLLEAHSNRISTITLTDNAPLSITATQLIADAKALLKIPGSYTITLTGTTTVAQLFAGNPTLVLKLTAPFAVGDTAATISGNIDALQAATSQVASIVVTDTGVPVSVTLAQLSADAPTLRKLTGTYVTALSSVVTVAQLAAVTPTLAALVTAGFAVSDTAAHVTAALVSLESLAGEIASIVLTDTTPVLSLTAAQLIANSPVLLEIAEPYQITLSGTATAAQAVATSPALVANVTAGFAVSDTSANVVTRLAGLETYAASITSIAFTDTSPVLTLTSAQLIADAPVLLKITSSFSITPSGTATSVQAIGTDPRLAARLTHGLAISDTSSNVITNLAALEAVAATVTSIVLTDATPALSLTGAQLIADAPILLKITSTHTIVVAGPATAAQAALMKNPLFALITTFTVADTAANVSSNLDLIEAHSRRISTITLTDNAPISITATQLIADGKALLEIPGSYTITLTGSATVAQVLGANPILVAKLPAHFAIIDTAANVGGNIDALQLLIGSVASIALTDVNPSLSVTASQLVADSATLATVTGSYTLLVASGTITAAQAVALPAGVKTHLSGQIAISDTATDVITNLSALQAMTGALATIGLTGSPNPISLTSSTLIADAGALGKLTGAYTLSASDTISIATLTTLAADYSAHLAPGALIVSDTGLNVFADMTALEALGTKLASITVTGAPLTLTAAQAEAPGVANNGFALVSYITGNVYDVTGATVADLTALASLHYHPAAITLEDSATAIAADLASGGSSAILPVLAQITGITVDSGPLVLTAAQATGVNGPTLVNLIAGHAYNVTGATVANLTTLSSAAFPFGTITVTDSASNIATDLGLGAGGSKILAAGVRITSIAFTGTLTLTVAEAETPGVAGSTGVINAIGGRAYYVTGALVSDVSTLAGLPYPPASIAISDSGTNVQNDLTGGSSVLLAHSGLISAITLPPNTTMTMTAAQAIAAAVVLQTVGTATLNLTAVAVNQLSAVEAIRNVSLLGIADTAANLQSDLASLSSVIVAAHANVSSFAITNGPAGITLTESQFTAPFVAPLLATASGLSVMNVTGVTLAQMPTVLGLAVPNTQMAVSDTTALIEADLTGGSSTLVADAAHITGVTLSDVGTLTLTVAQMATDHALLALIPHFQLVDTASNIQADLALGGTSTIVAALGDITGITVTNSGTPLVVTSAQLTSETAVFAKIAAYSVTVSDTIPITTVGTIITGYGGHLAANALTVSDTAANVYAGLATLEGLATELNTVTATGTASATQAIAIAGGLTTHVTGSISVSDIGSNVVFSLPGLLADLAHIGTITLLDPGAPQSVSSGQLSTYSTVFAKIAAYSVIVSDTIAIAAVTTIIAGFNTHLANNALSVSDTATAIIGDLTALETLGTKLNTVTVSGTATAAQLQTITTGLTSHFTGQVTAVNDTGAQVVANLANLLAANIGTITLSDVTSPMTVTSAQLSTYSAVFHEINGSWTAIVTDPLTIAAVNPIIAGYYGGHLAAGALIVSDTAANVFGDLGTLEGIGNELNTVTVGSATAAQAVAIAAGLTSHVASSIAVSDSVSGILSSLPGLLANISHIGTITDTDSNLLITATSTQLITYSTVFAKLAGSPAHNFAASDPVSVATLTALVANYGSALTFGAVHVGDTAAALSSATGFLATNAAEIAYVTVTGTATAAQAVTLEGLADSYGIAFPSGILVSDTGAGIVASFGGLNTAINIGDIVSITISDVGTPLALTSTLVSVNSDVFSHLVGSWTFTVSDTLSVAGIGIIVSVYNPHLATHALTASDTAASIYGGLTTLSGLGAKLNTITVTGTATVAQAVAIAAGLTTHVGGLIAISDTGTAVMSSLSNLLAEISYIGTITLTDSGTALSATSAQLIADSAVFAKIATYTVAVSDTMTVAAALSLIPYGAHLSPPLSISDTAAAVFAGRTSLGSSPLGNRTSQIVVTDSATVAQMIGIYSNLSLLVVPGIPVNDTGLNIVGGLSGLNTSRSKIGTITVSDASTPLAVTSTQLAADSAVFSKIVAWTATVSGTIGIASFLSITTNYAAHLVAQSLSVSDTAANITTNLSALQTYVGSIASIVLTDGSTPTIPVSTATLFSDAPALSLINSGYNLVVSGTATVLQIETLDTGVALHLTTGLAVSDTAANVVGAITALQTLGSTVGTIAVTGTATVAQVGLIVAGLSTHLTGSSIPVSDSAADVTTDLALGNASVLLSTVEAHPGLIPAITLTNPTTLTLTVAQITSDAAVLALIATGTYHIQVSDTAANVSADLALGNASVLLTTFQIHSQLINTIVLIGDPIALTLTIAQVTSDAVVLSAVSSLKIAYSDTALNIQHDLALGSLSKMVESQSAFYGLILPASSTITLTESQATGPYVANFLRGATGLASFVVTGVTLAQIATVTALTVPNTSVALSDTAAAVSADLAMGGTSTILVNSGIISGITLSDVTTISLTQTQALYAGIGAAVLAITNLTALDVTGVAVADVDQVAALSAYTSMAIDDTGTAVVGDLADLLTNLGKIGSITLSSPGTPLLVTSMELSAYGTVFGKLDSYSLTVNGPINVATVTAIVAGYTSHLAANALTVSDTAGAINSDLDALQDLGAKLGTITVNNVSSPAFTETSATVVRDAGALGKVTNAYTLTVSGNFLVADALTLNTDGIAALVAGGLIISDSAANVHAALGTLQAMGSAIRYVDLQSMPTTFAVTATELSQDGGILGKIITGSAVTLVADSVNASPASVAASLVGAPAYTGTLLFADTGVNVATYLNALQTLFTASHLGAITLSDALPPTLSITGAQLMGDTGALGKISSAYGLTITTALTAAQAIAVSAPLLGHITAALPIVDSAAAILTNLDALQGIVSAIGSVTFSPAATPNWSLTTTRVISDLGILSLVPGYRLSVSGSFTALQAAALSATTVQTHLISGAVVSDLSANVSAQLAPLELLALNNKLGTITLTDTSNLTVTPAQLVGDLAVFRLITGGYTFVLAGGPLSGALSADQAALIPPQLTSHLPSSLNVTDYAVNVLHNLDALEVLAVGNHLGVITLSDSGVPILLVTADQLTSDAAALADITSPHTLQIAGGITAAQAVIYAANISVLGAPVDVVDTAAAVQADLGSLETLATASLLNSITFTDTGTPNLTVTAGQFVSDADALLTVSGNYTVTISSGALTVAQIATAATQGLLSFVTGTVNVEDLGAHLVAGLGTLLTNLATIGTITVFDAGTPLVVTSAELSTDSTVFLQFVPGYTLTVSDPITTATVDSIITGYNADLAVGALTVSDTAFNVNGDLVALEGLGAKLLSVAVTDSATVAQAVAIAAGLTTTVSGTVAVSDMGAAIVSGLGNLFTNLAYIGTITVSDASTPLVVTSANLSTDITVFAKLAAGYSLDVMDVVTTATAATIFTHFPTQLAAGGLTVSDNASNIAGGLSTLTGIGLGLGHVTVTGTASATNAINIAVALAGVLSFPIAVADGGANLVISLDALQANIGSIGTITVNNLQTPLAVDSMQLIDDAAVFGNIVGGYKISLNDTIDTATLDQLSGYNARFVSNSVNVTDIAFNVNADLPALEALQALGVALGTVTVSDAATADQAVAIAAGLTASIGAHAIAVSDSGVNIGADLDSLETNIASISTITVSDGTPLAVVSTQLTTDSGVFARLSGSYALLVTDAVTAAVAAAIAIATYGTSLTTGGITVSDTAVNIDNHLVALQQLTTRLDTVTVTDNATADQAVAITAGLTTHIPPSSIAVSDTGAHIVSDLGTLETNIGSIGTITVSDSGTPLLVTSTQLANDSDVFTELAVSGYSLKVTDPISIVTANTIITTYEADFASNALHIADTAANVESDLPSLQMLGARLASVTISGPATADEAIAIAGGLGVLAGTMTVTDTGTAVVGDLPGLLLNIASITAITVSDASTMPLVVASTDLSTYNAVFMEIGSYTVIVSDLLTTTQVDTIISGYNAHLAPGALTVADTATAVAGDITALIGLGTKLLSVSVNDAAVVAEALTIFTLPSSYLSAPIAISDTGADIAAEFDGLETNITSISTITVSDSATLLVTSTQLSADGGVFLRLASGSFFTVTDPISAAAALAIDGTYDAALAAGALAVTDTAANLSGATAALGLIGAKLGSVTEAVSDAATADQAVTIAVGLTDHLSSGAITISDTGANIVTDFAALATNIAKIGTITVSDARTAPLLVTSDELTGDTTLVAKLVTAGCTFTVTDPVTAALALSISGTYSANLAAGALTVTDTATDVSANRVALSVLSTKLGTITVSDSATAYEASLITAALPGHLTAATIAVSDTGADIVGELTDLLNGVGKLSTITVSDASTALTVTSAELSADSTFFGKIAAYTLTDSDTNDIVTTNSIITGYNAHLAAGALNVSDTAANVTADLTALGNLGTKLGTVLVSGTATAAQAAAISALTSHITGGVDVTDTASNMIAHLDGLQTLEAAGSIGTFTLTTPTRAISVSALQFNADTTVVRAILNADTALNPVIYITGTSGGDTVDTSSLNSSTDISLGANTATMSFISAAATVTGTPNTVTLAGSNGPGANTLEYTAASGVEVINGFDFGRDLLNISLGSVSAADLSATDVTIGGAPAIAVTFAGSPTYGVLLVNSIGASVTAASLLSDHQFTAGSHVLIS
jgi:hypothetical protein